MTLARRTVDGIALLERAGQGLPLVLLHGVGSDAESWAPLLRALPEGTHAIAWDAPGYGGSAPLDVPLPAPADYAARLAVLLETLGLPRIRLAGHSLGCLFAAAFAAAHPGRVASLALASPALGYRVPPGAALPPGVQFRIDDLTALGPAEFAARRAPRLVFQPEANPVTLASVRRAMAAVHPAGYAQAVRALGAGDLLADAARLSMPTLLVTGADDVVTPPGNAAEVLAALPNPIRLVTFPACGHALPQEHRAALAALLAALPA
jgi:pimeloyl-ACP methyl ester carboxylesterase